MPGFALLATQLTDHSVRTRTLKVGGIDLMKQPGTGEGRYGVLLDTIALEEEGPGGVSSLTFTVDDPSRAVAVSERMPVEYWNVVRDEPDFAGFVKSWRVVPSGLGRQITVRCDGIEIVLDWMIVPALTIPSGTEVRAALQSILANATGIGVPLRALAHPSSALGNQAQPMGDLTQARFPGAVSTAQAVVLAGESVREAFRKVLDVCVPTGPVVVGDGTEYGVVTVDFWYGLRLWKSGVANKPLDYALFAVEDSVAGANAAAAPEHETDSGPVIRGVYITGGNAAGTGLVSDGTGLPGPIASLTDSSILTSDARDRAGVAYLTDKMRAERGSLTIETWVPTSGVRAGATLQFTDDQAGLSAQNFEISGISKSFEGATETWRIAYGRLPKRFTRRLRRLTRVVLS